MPRRYRLKAATLAIRDSSAEHPAAIITLPEGAEITTASDMDLYVVTEVGSLVDVDWHGTKFCMRLFDLLERGELLEGAAG